MSCAKKDEPRDYPLLLVGTRSQWKRKWFIKTILS